MFFVAEEMLVDVDMDVRMDTVDEDSATAPSANKHNLPWNTHYLDSLDPMTPPTA